MSAVSRLAETFVGEVRAYGRLCADPTGAQYANAERVAEAAVRSVILALVADPTLAAEALGCEVQSRMGLVPPDSVPGADREVVGGGVVVRRTLLAFPWEATP